MFKQKLYNIFMTKKYIDDDTTFLHDTDDNRESRQSFERPHKKRSSKKWLILFLSFGIFVFSSFLYVQASASPLSQGLKTLPWIQSISNLVNPSNNILENEEVDIINTVIIGMGGEGHDGGYLADTIILMRFKQSTGQIALISIPRDFAINLPGYGWRKINNANAYGGPELLAQMVSEILDEPVPYYITIDFNGFASLIDSLGGVDIYVEQSFTDMQFPDKDYEFQTVSFSQGMQHMDGFTALQFSRSRHGDNGEGSDFARAARQQKVIFAIKDKVLSANTLLNPSKLIALYNNFTKYVDTNITTSEMISLAQLAQGIRQNNIERAVLIDGPQGLLESTIYEDGAYLLIPKAGLGNYTEIRNYMNSLFESSTSSTESNTTQTNKTKASTSTSPKTPTNTQESKVTKAENPKAMIFNGTTIPGYAGTLTKILQGKNFEVLETANNMVQTLDKTTVYELNPGRTPNSRIILSNIISFDSLSKLPSDLENYISVLSGKENLKDADYVIILGSDNTGIIKE